ncbi:MAG TPA: hypothetical protein PK364_05285 [Synergistaceae bacterium]|nr:hypothetical protein [Synergistaceae bacterium]HPJ24522.1 hypothetical protein [Synergistaceae bacterium]HPQ36279.1 hypothetical protein [Synergistaceae bacterium]
MRFLKGHMGGNTILLLLEEDLGEEEDPLERVLRACSSEVLACHEAGILGRSPRKNALRLRIAARTSRAYISACGGLTQVLGRALALTELDKLLGLEIHRPGISSVLLETSGGPVPLRIEIGEDGITTWTEMRSFAEEIMASGMEPMTIRGISLLRMGKFLVLQGEDLQRALPEANIAALDSPTRRIIEEIQKEFLALRPQASKDLALYDHKGSGASPIRVIFPHWLPENHIEPACGTGTVAVGMAILQRSGGVSRGGKKLSFSMESGGAPILGGPDRSSLELTLERGVIRKAAFSHSFVELTARGEIPEGGDRAFSMREKT